MTMTIPPEKTRLLADAVVSRGGWYHGRSWLTAKDIKAAEKRWADRSYRRAPEEDYQCGGCKYFAALGSDYGICWCEDSSLDGAITFEHGGCNQHSARPLPSSRPKPEIVRGRIVGTQKRPDLVLNIED